MSGAWRLHSRLLVKDVSKSHDDIVPHDDGVPPLTTSKASPCSFETCLGVERDDEHRFRSSPL